MDHVWITSCMFLPWMKQAWGRSIAVAAGVPARNKSLLDLQFYVRCKQGQLDICRWFQLFLWFQTCKQHDSLNARRCWLNVRSWCWYCIIFWFFMFEYDIVWQIKSSLKELTKKQALCLIVSSSLWLPSFCLLLTFAKCRKIVRGTGDSHDKQASLTSGKTKLEYRCHLSSDVVLTQIQGFLTLKESEKSNTLVFHFALKKHNSGWFLALQLRWSLSPWISRRLADRPCNAKQHEGWWVGPTASLSHFFVDGFSLFPMFFWLRFEHWNTNPTYHAMLWQKSSHWSHWMCLEPTLGSRQGYTRNIWITGKVQGTAIYSMYVWYM